ncbi:MAG TPA: pilus assembly protein TadG-related protein [Candidatus Limnocylindria bacterium]|nr:pilus assembly protein TadG-related protein [Candidatus Limnocylindria bacterium]
MSHRSWSADGQAGQALVMVAIVFMALLFVVGLAVDAGQLFAAKRTQQEAADAAAFAGAVVLYQGGTVLQATQAAVDDASKNGFVNGVDSTTVTVNGSASASSNGPTSGPFATETPVQHVEVIIVRQVKTTLVPAEAAFNPVRARGVAGSESLNNAYAIMALGASCATAGITVSPNENIHVYGGGILSNSCSTSAVSGFSSSQDLKICATLPAPCTPNGYALSVVGGTTGNTFPAGVTVSTGITAVADPFAGYPKPDGKSYNGLSTLPTNPAKIGGTNTAVEGIYTTQLTNVALCHGIYILKGTGMAANGGDISRDTNPAHIDPNTNTPCDGNVLIYNAMSLFPLSTGSCGDLLGTTSYGITIRPMTTGPFANMSIYQDPACTASLQVSGGNTLDVGGTIYMANGTISLNGNPATISGGQIVAKTINVQNGNLNITFSSASTASPKLPRLAE